MISLTTDRLHLTLEFGVCLLSMVALILLLRERKRLSCGASESDSRDEAIREQAKTQAALLREVNHRVRNNFSSLIGLLQMKRDFARSPEEAAHLKDMETRLAGLAAVHNMLSLNGWKPIGLGELCRVLIQKTTGLAGSPCEVKIEAGPDDVTVPHSQSHPLTLIINELASNAIQHGRRPNTPMAIQVTISSPNDAIRLTFADNGPGYPADILRSPSLSRGSGLKIIQDLATSSLRGNLSLSYDHGAMACITFPRQTPNPEAGLP